MTLQKLEEGSTWPELVPGDGRGEYVVSEEQAALIHERLTYLTVDDLVRDARTHAHTRALTKTHIHTKTHTHTPIHPLLALS